MPGAGDIVEKWLPQARKGLLEMLILELLAGRTSYGYEIATRLKTALDADIAEGTLYPLLKRLLRDDLVTTRWATEGAGGPRKYYEITPLGREVLEGMRAEFRRVTAATRELKA